MEEKDFEDIDDEEFAILVNGIIHPDEAFAPPDLMGLQFPGAAPNMAQPASPFPTGSFDDFIARAYDEEEEEEDQGL